MTPSLIFREAEESGEDSTAKGQIPFLLLPPWCKCEWDIPRWTVSGYSLLRMAANQLVFPTQFVPISSSAQVCSIFTPNMMRGLPLCAYCILIDWTIAEGYRHQAQLSFLDSSKYFHQSTFLQVHIGDQAVRVNYDAHMSHSFSSHLR